MKLRNKRILFATLALLASGAAIAQQALPPFLNGIDTQHTRQILEAGMFAVDRNTALTATAGGTQATSILLSRGINEFTTVATAADSALLPNYPRGLIILIANRGANSMNIFPPVGGTIFGAITGGGTANTAAALPAGRNATIWQGTNGIWYMNTGAAA